MNTAAYDAGLPCKNPNCKSHGAPHPNCRCYGNLADGGKVKYFCESKRDHNSDCEYFVDGGVVGGEPDQGDIAATPQAEPNQNDIASVQTSAEPDQGDIAPVNQPDSDPQYLATALEGAGRGIIPGADIISNGMRNTASALGVPQEYLHYIAPSKEDLLQHQEENPTLSRGAEAAGLVGSSLTGFGVAGMAEKAAAKLLPKAAANALGTIGASAIKGAITSGMIQANDELSNAFLHDINPQDAVGPALLHMGYAGLAGLVAGGAFGSGTAALRKIGADKASKFSKDVLTGIGKSNLPEQEAWAGKLWGLAEPETKSAGVKLGEKLSEMIPTPSTIAKSAAGAIGTPIGGGIGGFIGGPSGAATGAVMGGAAAVKQLAPYIEKIVGKPLNTLTKKTIPWIAMKTLSKGDTHGLWNLLDYAGTVAKGESALNKAIGAAFSGGGQQAYQSYLDTKKYRGKLNDYINSGGVEPEIEKENNNSTNNPAQHGIPPQFADGGIVDKTSMPASNDKSKGIFDDNTALAQHYPAQNMMLQTAKGRVAGYLNSIRPNSFGKSRLSFETQHDDPNAQHEYNKALDLANAPLNILNHIQDGSLDIKHVRHMTQMYPEAYQHMSKKITERIVQSQMDGKDGEKPPYHVRQALSLFLGAPMDSSFTPGSILAAQATFQPEAPVDALASPGKAQKGRPSKVTDKGPQSYQTASQAAERDTTSRD